MESSLIELSSGLNRTKGAPHDLVESVMSQLGVAPPIDYVAFMTDTNGAEGFLEGNGYLVIHSIELLIPCNEPYIQVGNSPKLVIFGSNGGGTAYAFDIRGDNLGIVAFDPICMELGPVVFCGRTFKEFLVYLKSSKID